MSKPTPGPWKLAALNTNYAIRAKSDDVLICQMSWHSSHRMHYTLKQESFANARLIAAAPDLLAALQEAKHMFAGEYPLHPTTERIFAAIEKATGEIA